MNFHVTFNIIYKKKKFPQPLFPRTRARYINAIVSLCARRAPRAWNFHCLFKLSEYYYFFFLFFHFIFCLKTLELIKNDAVEDLI